MLLTHNSTVLYNISVQYIRLSPCSFWYAYYFWLLSNGIKKKCLSLPQTKMTSVILIATPLLIREAMIFIKCSSASRPIYIKAMMKVNGRKQFFYEQHKTG